MTGIDLIRVNAANEIYKFVAHAVQRVVARGGTFSVENPITSYYWDILKILIFTNASKVGGARSAAGGGQT